MRPLVALAGIRGALDHSSDLRHVQATETEELVMACEQIGLRRTQGPDPAFEARQASGDQPRARIRQRPGERLSATPRVLQSRAIAIDSARPNPGVLVDALRNQGVLDTPQWRFLQSLFDLRHLCAHSRGREPSDEEVTSLIDGVAKMCRSLT